MPMLTDLPCGLRDDQAPSWLLPWGLPTWCTPCTWCPGLGCLGQEPSLSQLCPSMVGGEALSEVAPGSSVDPFP